MPQKVEFPWPGCREFNFYQDADGDSCLDGCAFSSSFSYRKVFFSGAIFIRFFIGFLTQGYNSPHCTDYQNSRQSSRGAHRMIQHKTDQCYMDIQSPGLCSSLSPQLARPPTNGYDKHLQYLVLKYSILESIRIQYFRYKTRDNLLDRIPLEVSCLFVSVTVFPSSCHVTLTLLLHLM